MARFILWLCVLLLATSNANARAQQVLQMLSHYDGTVPAPAPAGVTKHYNPLFQTADQARTWDPMYPDPFYYEKVSVTFEPACPMKMGADEKSFAPVTDCQKSEKEDVLSSMKMVYAVLQGPKKEGIKSIGVSASEDSPAPLILSVKDGDGADLKHTLYRMGTEWWVHYIFVKPTVKRQFYTVAVEFQLRKAILGGVGSNTFKAPWLQEWSAPVKEMQVLFSFPKGYRLKKFELEPSTSLRGDDEPSQISSVCCGSGGPKPDKCTNDDSLGSRWAKGACHNNTVLLSTTLAVAKTDGGSPDDGIPLDELYRVEFSPGMVEGLSGTVDRGSWLWMLLILVPTLLVAGALILWASLEVSKLFRKGGYGDEEDDMLYQKAA